MKLNYPLLLLIIGSFITLAFSCDKKKRDNNPNPPSPPDTAVVIKPPVEPLTAHTIGFFLDDWQPKNFITPAAYTDTTIPAAAINTTVTIDASDIITNIPKSIAGNNANLWMSQIVTEPSLMSDIANLHPHIIRFPGGSISDIFLWNAPKNAPPADAPEQLVSANGTKSNSGFWYGKNDENWTLSVENYYKLLEQTGNSGMITINYGYARYGTGKNPVAAAAHLAADWVRYDNGRTQYWEIGNENFGDWEAGYRIDLSKNKDGQPEIITGDLYGKHFNIFADSMRKAAQETGKTIYIGAVMVEAVPQSWETNTRKTWNAGLLSQSANKPDFYIVHNYYTPYQTNSNATDILNSAPAETKKMMDYVTQTLQNRGAIIKPVALDEWNINAEGSMQKVSHINGMHGIMIIGEALKNKYGLTARWDLANGWANGNDHGLFSNGDEPGVNKWTPRPAFYHMYFFKKFLGDRLVTSNSTNADIMSYAATFSSGQVNITLVNISTSAQPLEVKVQNVTIGKRIYWYTLTGGNENGEFSRKVFVNGQGPAGIAGGPADYATLKPYSTTVQNSIKITLPPRSVICMVVDKK